MLQWPVGKEVTKLSHLVVAPLNPMEESLDFPTPASCLLEALLDGQCKDWVNCYECHHYFLLDVEKMSGGYLVALVFNVIDQEYQAVVFM